MHLVAIAVLEGGCNQQSLDHRVEAFLSACKQVTQLVTNTLERVVVRGVTFFGAGPAGW
jgi:hypothetical protein